MKSKILLLLASVSLLATSAFSAAAIRGMPRSVPTWNDLSGESIQMWKSLIVEDTGAVVVGTATADLPSWAADDAEGLAAADSSATGKWVRARVGGYYDPAVDLTLDGLNASTFTVESALGFPGKGYDVREFGAIPDDDTSDITAFQACVAAAEAANVAVMIGPGVYDFTSTGSYIEPANNLRIVGQGQNSVIRHNGLGAETSFIRMTTATNVVLENLTIEDARYSVYVPDAVPNDMFVMMRNVNIDNCRYGVFCSRTVDGTETLARGILFDNVLFQKDSTADGSAAIWWRGAPAQLIAVQNSRFEGGCFGISVAMDDIDMAYNPATLNPRLVVTSSYFTGQNSATSAHQAIEVLAYSPYIVGNVFSQGSTVSSTSAEAQAIYAYAGSGLIGWNLFDRWGNSTDKPKTIILKGASLQNDPYDTGTLGGSYNLPAGWGVQVIGNRFADQRGANNVGCGKFSIDTDGITLSYNVWEGFDDSYVLNVAPSTSNTDDAYIDLHHNWFVRCSWTELVHLQFSGYLARRVHVDDNDFLWINPNTANPSGNPYILYLYDSTVDAKLRRNHFYYCNKAVGLRAGIGAGAYANNIEVSGNYAVCDPTDIMSRLFYGATAGSLTNVVIRDNFSDYVNRPVDLNTGATYVGLEVSGNVANSYGTGNQIPYGTPSGSNHRVFNNNNNGTVDFLSADFRGVTTTTPTKFIQAGSTFLSNSVFHVYTGSDWVRVSP